MATVLKQRVGFLDGETAPAVIELRDNNTLVLSKINPTSGKKEKDGTVFTTPLSALTVSGVRNRMTFTVSGVKRRINFSPAISQAEHDALIAAADPATTAGAAIPTWITAFRARGATVRYISRGIAIFYGVLGLAALLILFLVFDLGASVINEIVSIASN